MASEHAVVEHLGVVRLDIALSEGRRCSMARHSSPTTARHRSQESNTPRCLHRSPPPRCSGPRHTPSVAPPFCIGWQWHGKPGACPAMRSDTHAAPLISFSLEHPPGFKASPTPTINCSGMLRRTPSSPRQALILTDSVEERVGEVPSSFEALFLPRR